MVVDIGTGDGRFVLAAASAAPEQLVIGVDAVADAMAEASRRAARPQPKGGLPNALFVVAAVEALPLELDGRASLVTVHFPWGSLLRGIVGGDPAVLDSLARLTGPGAELRTLLSVTDRDGVGSVNLPALVAAQSPATSLRLCEARPATTADIAASHSTWAKRLRAGTDRPVWLLRWERVC